MAKALQVRNHPTAQRFTDRLIDLFDDSDVGWDAARAIGQIVSADKVLTKKNHAVIKVDRFILLKNAFQVLRVSVVSLRAKILKRHASTPNRGGKVIKR